MLFGGDFMSTILKLDNVHKSYGTTEIIKGISFEVNQGEIYGFLGANGAGKTTTIRMITGLIKPTKAISILMVTIFKNSL